MAVSRDPQARPAELVRLLSRVALRDRSAFAEVYQRTAGHLLGIAYAVLHHDGRAEEVLQEAFVNIWQGADRYDPAIAQPMTWLINIVRHKAIDRQRAGRTERERTVAFDESLHDVAADASWQPQALFDDSLAKARIERCMADLGAAQRQAIALAYYRGLVHTEIAEVLGAPLGTVKAWVRRGLDRLRDCLLAAGVSA